MGHVIVKGNPGDSVLVAHQCPYDVARDGGHNQDLAARGHKHAPGWARVHTYTPQTRAHKSAVGCMWQCEAGNHARNTRDQTRRRAVGGAHRGRQRVTGRGGGGGSTHAKHGTWGRSARPSSLTPHSNRHRFILSMEKQLEGCPCGIGLQLSLPIVRRKDRSGWADHYRGFTIWENTLT